MGPPLPCSPGSYLGSPCGTRCPRQRSGVLWGVWMPRPRWWVQQESTATGTDREGRGYTLRDGDLRGWTLVDVVPVVCKQGVRGSSPLSSTWSEAKFEQPGPGSTAAKYSNRDRLSGRTRVRVGPCSRGRWRTGPRSWTKFRATEQEERLSGTQPCSAGARWAECRICRFKAGSCRSGRGSANGELFPSRVVKSLVARHKPITHISPSIWLSVAAAGKTDARPDHPVLCVIGCC
jgi:hypothetical protein